MSLRQFIESNGATCDNWRWSWSYVNHAKKFVIFGEWQNDPEITEIGVILDSRWEYNNGRKQSGYGQSMEHIDLIQHHGYELKTFPMTMKPRMKNTTAEMEGFTPHLTTKSLRVEIKNGFTSYFAD